MIFPEETHKHNMDIDKYEYTNINSSLPYITMPMK